MVLTFFCQSLYIRIYLKLKGTVLRFVILRTLGGHSEMKESNGEIRGYLLNGFR